MSYSLNPEELIVDLFAGGGGASTGIELAMGRSPNVAINHDPAAVQMHMANHPASEHHCESIYDVEPRMVTRGKPVGILWASPSCTHFSRARGGTPVSKQERGLGWMIPKWAGLTRPRIIICENVPEWVTWGPVRRGRPVKRKAGQYFKLMKSQLTAMGYVVEDRVLNAADYGTPTSRKRLFLIARNDGQSIVWPEPTHGPRAAKSYRAAAECIDWNDLGHSIFERKKPLAAATCRRIAAGIVRHVIQAKEPFIVNLRGTNAHHLDASASSIHDPLRTISAGGNHHALCTVFLEKHYSGAIHHGVQAIPASLTAPDHRSLIAAHLTTIDQQSNKNGSRSAHEPLTTITHKQRHALVTAFITTYVSGDKNANAISKSIPAVVTKAQDVFVTFEINGTSYAIYDIRLRMLSPIELARAQGFPSDYILTGTQIQKIGRIGNSVCPPVAQALIAANTTRITVDQAA